MSTAYKYSDILQDLCLKELKGTQIADNFSVSPSYISQIKGGIKRLKIAPKIIDNKLVCSKCDEGGDGKVFSIYRSENGEPIAIVCNKCRRLIEYGQIDFGTNNDYKAGFIVMYSFFKDIMGDIDNIITSEKGQDNWNSTWNKYNNKWELIDKLKEGI